MFLGLAIAAGAIAGFGPSRISKDFLDVCKKMLSAAFIIGMATAIGSILTAGNIMDTVVHALTGGVDADYDAAFRSAGCDQGFSSGSWWELCF